MWRLCEKSIGRSTSYLLARDGSFPPLVLHDGPVEEVAVPFRAPGPVDRLREQYVHDITYVLALDSSAGEG